MVTERGNAKVRENRIWGWPIPDRDAADAERDVAISEGWVNVHIARVTNPFSMTDNYTGSWIVFGDVEV